MGKRKRTSRRHGLYFFVSLLLTLVVSFSYAAVLWQEVEQPAGNGNSSSSGPSSLTKVESIELNTSDAKTEFAWGEAFSAEGLKVTAKMSDGTTQEVSVEDCRIIAPDMEKAGQRGVSVVYEGKTARYQITIAQRVLPTIPAKSLLDITEANNGRTYRVEAEKIDMETIGVQKPEGVTSFVGNAPEGAELTSENKYLTGFGVRRNYFGFTFTADKAYESIILVLRVANANEGTLSMGDAMSLYVNHALTETSELGKIDLAGYTVEGGACVWKDIVIRNVGIKEGVNTLTFEALGDKIADVDYIDFYVGTRYINSIVEISGTDKIVKDLETFDTEKAFTRVDVAAAHGLKDGQLFVENVTAESPGKTTHGGKSVGAIGKGSELSTTLRLAQDATVKINFIGSSVNKGAYYVAENWDFSIDGYDLKLVERTNIEGGNSGAGQWWDWMPTSLGVYNLPAGDHFFLMQVNGTDCNVDTIDFEIISYGSYDESGMTLEEQANLHDCESKCGVCGGCKDDECEQPACTDKCTCTAGVLTADGLTVEAETFGHEHVKSRQDFVDAGRMPDGQYFTEGATGASGGKAICGFIAGTKFIVKVNVTIDMKAKIEMIGATDAEYPVAEKMKISVDGNEVTGIQGSLTGTEQPAYWDWQRILLGEFELTAGLHTITIEIVDGQPNLDCLVFTPTEYDENAAEYDAVLSATNDTTLEAEAFSHEYVKSRQDFVDIGRMPDGQYFTEGATGASGGKAICGFTAGTKFVVKVKAPIDMKVKIEMVGATDAEYPVAEKMKISVDGNEVTGIQGSLTGTEQPTYWDWQRILLGEFALTAGAHTITIEIVDGHPNLDCLTFIPVEEAAHEHSYDNACDTTCNGCGEVRETTHTPAADDGDCTTKIVCAECGAETTAAKTHAYTNACDTTCNNDGCTQVRTIEHTYDNACDTTCNECGDVREITHAFSDTYLLKDADENKHYHVCTECGAKDEGAAHAPNVDAATEETAKYCTVCTYVIEPQLNHVHTFEEKVVEAYKVSDATCAAKAVYYKSCRCGDKSDETFTTGDLLEHTYDNACDGNCNVCKQDSREPAAHVPAEDDGNCLTEIKCTVCGTVTTEAQEAHVYSGASDADCNECGKTRVVSVTELNEVTTVVKDLENFNAMKATTRSDIVDAYKLQPGQLFVEDVKQESPGKTTNGGKSVGALVGGSVSTVLKLEKDATVKFEFVAAAAASYFVADNWSFSIDGVKLVMVEKKDIKGGNPDAGEYWDWFTTDLGTYNLPAGEHEFVLEVKGGSCNIDCVNFEVLSVGSYDKAGYALDGQVKIDAQLSATERTAIGMHTLDKAGVVTRWDAVGAAGGQGNYGAVGDASAYFGTRIYWLGNGTSFTVNVYAAVAGEYEVAFRSYGMGNANAKLTVDGVEYTEWTQKADNGNWYFVSFGIIDLSVGIHTVTITFVGENTEGQPNPPDLDSFVFTPAHVCENVCPRCDKCLNKACDEEACANKCEGHIDVTISATEEVRFEAESFDDSQVVSDPDQVAHNRVENGKYGKEGASGASGGYCIYGFTQGTVFTVNVNVTEAGKYKLDLIGACGGTYVVSEGMKVFVDGVEITGIEGVLTGAGDHPYWDWHTVTLGEFAWAVGVHTIELKIISGANLDCLVFTPVTVTEHICYNKCDVEYCGLCTDFECAEDVCAEKCPDDHDVAVDATVAVDTRTIIEAETFSKEGVITRSDFVPSLGAGNYATVGDNGAYGGTRIYGLGDKTTFTWKVRVVKAGQYTAYLRSFGVALEKLSVTVDGVACANLTQASDNGWQNSYFGKFDWKVGVHTVTLTFLEGNGNVPDLDAFVVLPVFAQENSIVVEAETFGDEGVVSRKDFVDAGRMPDGQYFTESSIGANGGKSIGGFKEGTKFTVTVNVTEAGKYTLYMIGANDEANYNVSEKMKISVDDTVVTGIQGSLTGQTYPAYWDWKTITVGTFDLTAGTHTIVIEIVGGHPNLDCLILTPVAA